MKKKAFPITKIVLLSLALTLLLASLCACEMVDVFWDKITPPQTTCEVIAELAEKNYTSISISIDTETDGITLCARYTVTSAEVAYSIEKMNLLPTDGSAPSPDEKTVLTGTATIENGKITGIDGKALDLPTENELKGAFNFNESHLSNIEETDGRFTATVTSPSDFMGRETDAFDMSVVVEYDAVALKTIRLSYKTPLSTVNAVYAFQK